MDLVQVQVQILIMPGASAAVTVVTAVTVAAVNAALPKSMGVAPKAAISGGAGVSCRSTCRKYV